MPQVIFINRFYWPDETATAQLLADLAESLAARGLDVTVIASRPAGGGAAPSELRNGVRIIRTAGTRSRHPGVFAKALDFGTFLPGALARLLRTAGRGDAVVALTDPPLIGAAAGLISAIRGARCFHWVQDIYPEIAIAVSGRRELACLRPLRNAAWRRAAGCVTLGRDMAGVLEASGVPPARISVVPNWAPRGVRPAPPEAIAALRSAWGAGGRLIAAYSGNLGRVHDLGPVMAAAGELKDDPEILFLFIGSGAQRAVLEAEAVRRSLPNVRFLPPQPIGNLSAALGAGDVHLVTLRAGCEKYVFPSKIYGAAAVGRPVLVVGPRGCEPARIVAERGFGRAFTPGEPGALAQFLRELRADPALRSRLGAAALDFSGSCTAGAAAETWSRLLALSGGAPHTGGRREASAP